MSTPAPAATDPRWRAAEADARRQVRERRGLLKMAILFGAIVPMLWLINLSTSPRVLWAIWPTLGMGIALLARVGSLFAVQRLLGRDWEERKVAELMARENLRVERGEKQLAQAQLKLLQAQIEPHFLFNTLATIRAAIRHDPTLAGRMMEDFIDYLRQTLSASRAQHGTVGQEFALLRQYLELIRIRMDDRLRYELVLPDALASLALPPMLLQPLVENAIRHGLEPKVEGGRLRVEARRVDANRLDSHVQSTSLLLSVEDDGLGFGRHPDARGTGVGLGHLRERLALLYGGRAELSIRDAEPGTRIEILLPIEEVKAETT